MGLEEDRFDSGGDGCPGQQRGSLRASGAGGAIATWKLGAVRHIEAHGGGEVRGDLGEITESDEVGHQSVVSKERPPFGRHHSPAPGFPKFLQHQSHFHGGEELAFLHGDRGSGGSAGGEEIGLAAEKSRYLQEIHDLCRGVGLSGFVDISEDRHTERVSDGGELAQAGVFGMILCYYFVALLPETLLSVWLVEKTNRHSVAKA